VIDPANNKLVLAGTRGSESDIREIALDTGAVSASYRDASCAGALAINYYGGMSYDASARKVVIWPDYGNTIYLYDPATHACTAETYPNGPSNSAQGGTELPGGGSSNGTYGRFQYVSTGDYFVVINDWKLPAFVLCRKATGCGP
jgi:hypothetical protein